MRLLVIFLLSSPLFSYAQKLTFDIFLFGDKVGQTVVERTKKSDSVTVYTLNSSSDTRIFFVNRKTSLHFDELYKYGQLISSYSKNVRNDEVIITTVEWRQNSYILKRANESFCIKPPIYCSTVQLFFEEPCDSKQVFAERMGEFRSVKKTGEGIYEAPMPDGLLYIYHYKNGKLVELEMKKGMLGTAYLRPQ